MQRIALSLVLTVGLLAGCVSTGVAPRTSLSDRSCSTSINLENAHAVSFSGSENKAVTVDDTAGCLESDGKRVAYVVFRLPPAEAQYLLYVSSHAQGVTIMSPDLALLDDAGKVIRQVRRDEFTFRGRALSFAGRIQPEARYLVVRSDPETVGKYVSQIVSETASGVAPVGAGFVAIYSGSEATRQLIFAHNGVVQVSASPIAKAG